MVVPTQPLHRRIVPMQSVHRHDVSHVADGHSMRNLHRVSAAARCSGDIARRQAIRDACHLPDAQ